MFPHSINITKSSWGSRSNFQASYGSIMTPEDIKEEKEILKAMEQADKEKKNHRN